MVPRLLFLLLFVLLLLVGGILRYVNLSPFLIYPDSYQNLITVENIRTYSGVVGYLGKEGMLYPPFIAWSRFGFPLMITIASLISGSTLPTAAILPFIFGLLSLPIAFILGRQQYSSSIIGIISLLFLTLSFNHIVWGGFILTETLGVLMLLLLLFLLHKKRTAISPYLIGSIFTLCIITRYEYLLLLPLIIWYMTKMYFTRKEIITMFLTFFMSSLLLFGLLFPTENLYAILTNQLSSISLKVVSFLIVISLGYLSFRRLSILNRERSIDVVLSLFLTLCLTLTFISYVGVLFPSYLPGVQSMLGGLRDFMRNDFLIWLAFLAGYYFLLKGKTHRVYLLFITFSLILLYIAYYLTNPLMERYITHLIPFLLLPSLEGIQQGSNYIRQKKKHLRVVSIFLIALILQASNSYRGIRHYASGSYFQTSYEQEAALRIKKLVPKNNVILITSLPEAYFVWTGVSTQSIADKKPYVNFNTLKDTDELIIIDDAPMRDIFPTFSHFITEQLKAYKRETFMIDRYYHYADNTTYDKKPVTVYRITVNELKKRIELHQI